jgi:hypothetical protein
MLHLTTMMPCSRWWGLPAKTIWMRRTSVLPFHRWRHREVICAPPQSRMEVEGSGAGQGLFNRSSLPLISRRPYGTNS